MHLGPRGSGAESGLDGQWEVCQRLGLTAVLRARAGANRIKAYKSLSQYIRMVQICQEFSMALLGNRTRQGLTQNEVWFSHKDNK